MNFETKRIEILNILKIDKIIKIELTLILA